MNKPKKWRFCSDDSPFSKRWCVASKWYFHMGGRNGESKFQNVFPQGIWSTPSWCGECLHMFQEGFHISPVTRWWFETCFMFTPKPCEMMKFDGCICFKMGWFKRQLGDDFPRFLWRSINTCIQLDFQGPPITGPLYDKFPILFPYHSHKNP